MLWIAVHLPLLSLEAFAATLTGSLHAGPVALLAEHRISAVNAAALQRGLRPGLKRATALALAPEVTLGQADPGRDAQALQAVAYAALAFTPAVSPQPPDTVLLEVKASLRCFGGPAALLQRLRDRLAPLGHALQIASAPTALGAALLARWRGSRSEMAIGAHSTQPAALQALLDAAPLALLDAGREHHQTLQGMGLHSLADLRHLPRAGLARRFGESLLADLDRAYGTRPDPRPVVTLPPAFHSRLELFARAETTEQVLHGAVVLLSRLLAWAQAQHARVAGFTLVMRHEPAGPPQGRIPECAARRYTSEPAGPPQGRIPECAARRYTSEPRLRNAGRCPAQTELALALAEPSGDAAHLQLLLRERLARLSLAAPTLELGLHCSHVVHGEPPNAELFPTRASEQEGLTRLIERLRARLGEPQVQRVVPVPDHRPERASVMQPVPDGVPPRTELIGPPAAAPRPVWLLAQPLALPERRSLPLLDGWPLQLLSGPERIEAGWWDGELATRDYFIAQAADGALVWIYRTRLPPPVPPLPEAQRTEAGWFLQGRFG